jgi:hypothetical protein
LQQLKEEADGLWPPHPGTIPALRDWLERAHEQVSRLDLHRATLEGMRPNASATTSDGEWLFDETSDQWRHGLLTELIDGLDSLRSDLMSKDAVTPEFWWSMPKRLSFAEDMDAGFAPGGEYAVAWERALPRIHCGSELRLAPWYGVHARLFRPNDPRRFEDVMIVFPWIGQRSIGVRLRSTEAKRRAGHR